MTAVSISQSGWEKSDYVVLARGDGFADALCAAPLAAQYGAPLLLTRPDNINEEILKEILRLDASHVILVGGHGALSSNIESGLKLAGINDIIRIGGQDRYETSVKIAEVLGTCNVVAVATGLDYPDAIAISSIAAMINMPILLTENDKLPDTTIKYLRSKAISKTYVVGGTGVINESVFRLLPNPVRLGGRDRFETGVMVIKEFEDKLDFNNIYAAVGEGTNGDEYADALSGSVLASKRRAPLLLVYGILPDVVKKFLMSKLTSNCSITAFGGEAVVPQNVIEEISKYIKKTSEQPVQAGGGGGSLDSMNVSINSIKDMVLTSGEIRYVTVTSFPANAIITAAIDNRDIAEVSAEVGNLTIKALKQGKASVTVTASKIGYNPGTLTFSVFVEPVKLSWNIDPGDRKVGEIVTFKLESDLIGGFVPHNEIVYILNWTRDGLPIKKEDIVLNCNQEYISNIDGAQGIFKIGSPHLVRAYESYVITAVFNTEGAYNLTAYAAKYIQ